MMTQLKCRKNVFPTGHVLYIPPDINDLQTHWNFFWIINFCSFKIDKQPLDGVLVKKDILEF